MKPFATSIAVGLVTGLLLAAPAALGAPRLDADFGAGGIAVLDQDIAWGATSVAEDEQGRLVISGSYRRSNSQCHGIYASRILGSGRPDKRFGDEGMFWGSPASCDYSRAISIGSDGSLIVAGGTRCISRCFPLVQKLTRNGSGFPGWGFGKHPGRLQLQGAWAPTDASRDRRGRVLLTGQLLGRSGSEGGFLIRLSRNGKRDWRLSGDSGKSRGILSFPAPDGHYGSFAGVEALNNGKVLLAGVTSGRPVVLRLMNSGRRDLSFGRRSRFSIDIDGMPQCECAEVTAMSRDQRGRILVAGIEGVTQRNFSPFLFRLTPDGRLDRRFGEGGVTRPSLKLFRPAAIALQEDGRIVAVGIPKDDSLGDDWHPQIARLLSDGQMDESFFNGGVGALRGSEANDVIIDRVGRIVVAGADEYGNPQLTRILPR